MMRQQAGTAGFRAGSRLSSAPTILPASWSSLKWLASNWMPRQRIPRLTTAKNELAAEAKRDRALGLEPLAQVQHRHPSQRCQSGFMVALTLTRSGSEGTQAGLLRR